MKVKVGGRGIVDRTVYTGQNRNMDRQTNKWTNKWTNKKINGQINK